MSTVNTNATAIDTVMEGINKVNVSDNNNDDTSKVIQETCAACGKEGKSEDMNTCNKCKMVKYCNAACKKKHRTKHKKACERRVAELHEEALFKDPPPREDCPICFIPLPIDATQSSFFSCCGKLICDGCIYAMIMSEGKDLCAFCRTLRGANNEVKVKRLKILMDKGNAVALSMLGGAYADGMMGLRQDYQKANELYLKGGELGYAEGFFNLGSSYYYGRGVKIDKKKAKHYYELAAMGGNVQARYNLGVIVEDAGNEDRAYKHFIIAARAGSKRSLDAVKDGFMDGFLTKDEYTNTLRVYQESQDEMKSDERDKAAASQLYRSG